MLSGPGEKSRTDPADAAAKRAAFFKFFRFWPWLAALASGLLCAGCFAPFNVTWLCWLCLTPLLAAVWFSGGNASRPWLRDLLLGYVAGLAFFWPAFSWLISVTGLGWFVLQFYMAIYFAIWAWLAGLLRPRASLGPSPAPPQPTKWDQMLAAAGRAPAAPKPASPWLRSGHNLWLALLLASTWVTMEWLRGWVFSGFGWNDLGVALHANWPVIQVAEFTGVAGLSFVIAFANVIAVTTACRLIVEARDRVMRPHWDLNVTMVGIVALLTYGWHVSKLPVATKPLRVAAVQANIPRTEKFDRVFAQRIYDQFEKLSALALKAQPPPDLLVWPESSMPGPVLQDAFSNSFVMNLAGTTTADLLLGTIDIDGESDYNAAVLVSAEQEVQVYRKLHLVPFGEYVPFRHSFPLFAWIAGDQVPGDFAFGKDYTVFRMSGERGYAAPLICFEDTIGDLVRRFVLPHGDSPGASVLVNVTNDGWFLHSAGSKQHVANAIFRCVETRRPMVRAANTGVTCFVNQFGRITDILKDESGDTFGEGVLTGEINVPSEPTLTFYVRHGELFAHICIGVTIVAIAFGVIRKGSKSGPRNDANQPGAEEG